MTVIGLDISRWNGTWDAGKAKAAGAHFAFIKSSQATFTDPRFVENWQRARDAGILRGAYHYLDYTQPAAQQAKYFYDLLKDDMGELPLVVDFEHRTDDNVNLPKTYLRQFVDYLLSQDTVPMIYTAPSFWTTYGDSSTYWYQFPLWIAHYTLASAPIVPPPWLDWKFWQFTHKGPGALFGSESASIDVNRFNGSLEELNFLVGRETKSDLSERVKLLELRMTKIEENLSVSPPSQIPVPIQENSEEPILHTAIVVRDETPVQAGPFAALPVIGRLSRNISVEVVALNENWSRIKSPSGWVENVNLEAGGDELPEQADEQYVICSAQALNVRSGPSSESSVVGWLTKGQRARVLGQSNNWVQLDSPNGWAKSRYLLPA
jgi:lysozyme